MRMNRRNVLVGLGTIVAGGGAALGTGAFSSVEANRNVNINTDADDGALLQIVGNPNYGGTVGDYVTNGTSGGATNTTEISIGENSEGINENALTAFTSLLQVTNNGSQDAEFYVKDNNDLSSSPLDFQDGSSNSFVGGDNTGDTTATLQSGGGSTTVSVVVDLKDDSIDNIPDSVTFVADVDGA